MMQPKNQVNRERKVGDQHFGASPKPMLDENRKKGGAQPTDSTKQKPETPPDADSLGGGSQGGM
jgi:hypothetical protein